MKKTAVFAGSFDPFTVGHMDVCTEAAEVFDKVVIAIGVNPNKNRLFDEEEMAAAIRADIKSAGLDNVEVVTYKGLTVDLASSVGAKYLVRGLRNAADYSYEENAAEVNSLLSPDIETIYFRSKKSAVSSSTVKELLANAVDVSAYLTDSVLALTKK